MPQSKTALTGDDVMKTVAPVTSNVRNVWQLLPQPTSPEFSERVGDFVSAEDELNKQRKEGETPFWKRLLRNSLVGAGLGSGLASLKALPITKGFSPEAAAIGAGVGLIGSGGLTAARHLLRESLRDRAEKRVAEADPAVRFVARNPKTRAKAKEWESAQWAPYSGAELGGVVGGLGTLGASWALGKHPTTGQAWGMSLGGGLAGAVLGHILGRMYKNKKQKEFLQHTDMELSRMSHPSAQEAAVEAAVEQSPMQKAAISQEFLMDTIKLAAQPVGGWPKVSTNAGLLRGRGGKVDQYVSGKGGLAKFSVDAEEEFRQFCSDLEKLASDDSLSIQNSDPKGDGPTAPEQAAEQARGGAIVKVDVNKAPNNATEPSPSVKVSADSGKLRRRSEVIVSNNKGILAIKKRGYLLMPGGGIKEGEDPADAVRRETSEEAGRKLKYLTPARGSRSVDTLFDPNNIISEGFVGESTRFFTAQDAGEDGTTHKDREAFEFIPFDDAIKHLVNCMKRDDADWALANNAERLFLITKARDEADGTADTINDSEHAFEAEETVKVADAAVYAPKSEVIYFTPSGKIAVRRGKDRRYELPTDVPGATAVPYETPVSFLPEAGVQEPGVHGYKYHMHSAEGPLPEGFEEESPDTVLKNLYATLGNPKHREYMNLDRARARALLRLMKRREKPSV